MKSNRAATIQGGGRISRQTRRPFWLPALSFYALAALVSITLFFIVLAVTREADDENSLAFAGGAAILIILGAILLREVILSNARQRYLAAQKQLDLNIKRIAASRTEAGERKISVERNALILESIRKKSDAAKILKNLPETHREVFEACSEYLTISLDQLKNAGAGSPRLAVFRKGREKVKPLHYYHLLEWLQGEINVLLREAKIRVTLDERLSAAQKVLELIDSGLNFYPNDARLVDSQTVLRELVGTIKVSYWIEQAENALKGGDVRRAVECFYDARFFLGQGNIPETEKQLLNEKINKELSKITPEDIKKKDKFSVVTRDLEDQQ